MLRMPRVASRQSDVDNLQNFGFRKTIGVLYRQDQNIKSSSEKIDPTEAQKRIYLGRRNNLAMSEAKRWQKWKAGCLVVVIARNTGKEVTFHDCLRRDKVI